MHASTEEEEIDLNPLQKKQKTVKITVPPTTHKLGKYAQPSILISRTSSHRHTSTSTYGDDPQGEPTRTEVRPSEHISHGQGSSVRPKELATIAGSGGQGSNLFRLGSYVTELYGVSGRGQLLRELQSHYCD